MNGPKLKPISDRIVEMMKDQNDLTIRELIAQLKTDGYGKYSIQGACYGFFGKTYAELFSEQDARMKRGQ